MTPDEKYRYILTGILPSWIKRQLGLSVASLKVQVDGSGWFHALCIAPSCISVFGHGLTLMWLLGSSWTCGLLGLLCDCADGFVARRLKAESEFGSLYDWTIDVTVLVLLLFRLHVPWLVILAVPFAVYLRTLKVHASGRAALTFVALAVSFRG